MNFDEYYSQRHEWQDEYECPECGKPVDEEGKYCSNTCWEASML